MQPSTILDHLPKDSYRIIDPSKMKFLDFGLPWGAAYGLHCIRLWWEDLAIEKETGKIPPSRYPTPEEFKILWHGNMNWAAVRGGAHRALRERLVPSYMVDNLVSVVLRSRLKKRKRSRVCHGFGS